MNESARLIALGKKQFEAEILPELERQKLIDKILVYLCGSASLGFADENSDIDFDVLVSGKITVDEYSFLREIFADDYQIESKRVSYGFDLKKKFGEYLRSERENYWEDFNPYNLYMINHYVPVLDISVRLGELKKELGFYPKDIFISVVRGLWITVNDSGEYNSLQCFKRGNFIGADIFFYRGVEALLRLVFVMNDQYYPPTKWLSAGLQNITNQFETDKLLQTEDKKFEEKYALFMQSYRLMSEYLIQNNILEKECVENYGKNFAKDYYIFETF
jgi:predicted nucleotidyltransferase